MKPAFIATADFRFGVAAGCAATAGVADLPRLKASLPRRHAFTSGRATIELTIQTSLPGELENESTAHQQLSTSGSVWVERAPGRTTCNAQHAPDIGGGLATLALQHYYRPSLPPYSVRPSLALLSCRLLCLWSHSTT